MDADERFLGMSALRRLHDLIGQLNSARGLEATLQTIVDGVVDVVGFVGNTGRSRAPHLHYEVWVQDRPVTPLDYILEYDRSFDPKNRPLRASTAP